MGLEEKAAESRMMGNVYALLFECFAHPTSEFADKVRTGAVHGAFEALLQSAESEDLVHALALLDGSRFQGFDSGDLRLRLEADYNRLFVGPAKLIAPPYESVYLSKRDFFRGESEKDKAIIDPAYAAHLKSLYAEKGYFISKSFSDFPDHIMFELDFCSYLFKRAAESFERGDEAGGETMLLCEAEFVVRHPAAWIGSLTKRILGNTKLSFYDGAALLAQRIIELDAGVV